MGDSSPGPGVTPSMVVIAEPSACGANIRQERTAAPSTSTVQAPQTPCSQPPCAPVSPSLSRKVSSKVVRSSTSSVCLAPLTRSSMRISVCLGVGDGAYRERARCAAAILGRGVQVVERRDIGERGAHRLADACRIERAAGQLALGGVEPDRRFGRGADADGDPLAVAAAVQFDLRRRGDKGEIAAPCIDLMETAADLALPDRKAQAG